MTGVDPNLAAVLAFAGTVVNIIVGAVVLVLTRRNGVAIADTHTLVNSQTEALIAATAGQARAEGHIAGAASANDRRGAS